MLSGQSWDDHLKHYCAQQLHMEECNVRVQSRECRVESAESARAKSREEEAQCTMRAQCEYRVRAQRREHRVESAECESSESRVQSK